MTPEQAVVPAPRSVVRVSVKIPYANRSVFVHAARYYPPAADRGHRVITRIRGCDSESAFALDIGRLRIVYITCAVFYRIRVRARC